MFITGFQMQIVKSKFYSGFYKQIETQRLSQLYVNNILVGDFYQILYIHSKPRIFKWVTALSLRHSSQQ